ncbi:MAG: hypothetical protein ACWGQW_11690 [bacterium]
MEGKALYEQKLELTKELFSLLNKANDKISKLIDIENEVGSYDPDLDDIAIQLARVISYTDVYTDAVATMFEAANLD